MQRIIPLMILALLCTLPAAGQLRTWISMDAGPQWSLIKVDDPGNYFQDMAIMNSTAGFSVEQEIAGAFSVSAGFWYQGYSTGINMNDDRPDRQRIDAYNSFLVPLKLHYSIQPTEYPFYIIPHIGYTLRLGSMEASDLFRDQSLISAPDRTVFSYTHSRVNDPQGLHMVELGVGLGLRFSGDWQASARISWANGVLNSPSNLATVDYSDNLGTAHTATYNSKGNYLSTTLALHVPLSNIWQNRDYRIRSRIENSTFDGKSVDRKGSFYLGGELGTLWRLFHSSDPALSARPMEGRGFLRYANLHTGIYGGYMLSNELGVDLGILYQRSSSFYSLMYDHEVDLVVKSSAPLYLEIPLRFRYFYEAWKDKLWAVVYGGASILTQFSGFYEIPGGDFSYTSPLDQGTSAGSVTAVGERLSYVRPLVRLGAGAEYRIPIEFPLFATLYLNYAQGFMSAEVLTVDSDMPIGQSSTYLRYQGSGWSLDIGIKIPMAFDDRENCVRLTREKKIR